MTNISKEIKELFNDHRLSDEDIKSLTIKPDYDYICHIYRRKKKKDPG